MKREVKIISKIVFPLIVIVIYGYLIAFFLPKFNNWRINKSQFYLDEAKRKKDEANKLPLLQQATLLNPAENNLIETGIIASKTNKFNLAEIYLGQVKTANGFYQLANNYQQIGDYEEAEKYYLRAIEKEQNYKYWLTIGKNYLKQGKLAEAKQAFTKTSQSEEGLENQFFLALIGLINNNNEEFRENIEEVKPELKSEITKIFNTKKTSARINKAYDLLLTLGYPQLAYQYLQDNKEIIIKDRDGLIRLANEEYKRNKLDEAYRFLIAARTIDQYYPQTYRHLILIAGELKKTQEVEQYKEILSIITW